MDEGHAISYKLLERGTAVRTSDDVEIGTVDRVLENPREHIFDGIVITTPNGVRFVDAPEVARIAERRAMLVISAERGGLYANLTRLVELEELPPETARRVAATNDILVGMRDATRPGRPLSEVFADCRRLYAEAGYPDQWQLHHQGGSTGYGSREVIATPDTRDVVQMGQAFAWNPSITGAKAEETFVLTESGPDVVTGV